MPSGSEQEGLWSPASGGAHETFDGLELAEAATAPARLEDQPVDYSRADAGADPAAEAAASPDEGEGAAPARRRGRGGRPRVSADQDRRIVEAFERAKDQGRSLKDVAQDLAKELGQPPEYINQRYYYLRRRTRPAEPEAAARPAGRRRRAAATAAPEPPRAVGRRRAATARPAEPAPAEAPPARRRGRVVALAGVEDRLAQLSDIATRQLAALTERMERIEERLSALERRPAAHEAAPDEELYTRLGRMLVRAAFGALEGGR